MRLEVVSPEATLFSGEVNSVAVPGANGAFQVLDNHAPIVSILNPGTCLLYTSPSPRDRTRSRMPSSA